MKKGTFGIKLSFYAVLAFVLAFLGQTLLLGLLLGFVIVAEKDEWLTRQTMQAFFLTIAVSVIQGALSLISKLFSWIPTLGSISVGSVVSALFGWINWAVSVAALVFIIIAVIKVAKGNEANIPVFASLANRAYGIVKEKPVYQQPQYTQYPQQPQQPQYPQYSQQQPQYPQYSQQQPQYPQYPQQNIPPQNPQQ